MYRKHDFFPFQLNMQRTIHLQDTN